MSPHPLGAILAGGQSRRYGSHKALARVGGHRILDRVRRALAGVTPDVVLITNEPAVYSAAGLPMRPDARPGLGALGGIHTALLCAREDHRPGVLAVACDMPFLSSPLLHRLLAEAVAEVGELEMRELEVGELEVELELEAGVELELADEHATAPDVVAPESGGRRGIEPLCAYYSVRCLPVVEAELARGGRRVIDLYDAVHVRRLPIDTVRHFGEPETLFMNVNTPAERERAEQIATDADVASGVPPHPAEAMDRADAIDRGEGMDRGEAIARREAMDSAEAMERVDAMDRADAMDLADATDSAKAMDATKAMDPHESRGPYEGHGPCRGRRVVHRGRVGQP